MEEKTSNAAVLKTWTDDKEEFIRALCDGDYYVLKGLELAEVPDGGDKFFDEEDVIDSFMVNGGSDTGRLRDYCREFHPEVDFNTEFETYNPGVFSRYQDKFGYDYAEWIQEQIYAELCATLKDKGYRLPF